VYILEAHASDVWQMPSNIKQNIVFASPRSIEERTAVADSCVRNLHIEIPALLDGFRDATEAAYTSGPGPFGFHPQELQAALTRMLD